MTSIPVIDAASPINVSAAASIAEVPVSYTINLGSAKTFNLFQEAKLKSGQRSDEEFVRQILAEHHGLYARLAEDTVHVSRETQVDAFDMVENDIKTVNNPSHSPDFLHANCFQDVGCTPVGSSSVDDVDKDTKCISNLVPVESKSSNKKLKHSDISQPVVIEAHDNEPTTKKSNNLNIISDPVDNNVEKNEVTDDKEQIQGSSGTMFGCKECLMYFSKQNKLLSHIKTVHSDRLKDGAVCKDFVIQESTIAVCGKKKSSPVFPKVVFGMISEVEVSEAIENQQNKIKEERKRKRTARKKSPKPKVLKNLKCTECNMVFQRERSLQDHIKLRHTSSEKNNLPKCHICNKKFLYESIVKRHMLLRHSQKSATKVSKHTKGFLCETCGATFTQKHTLKLHMNKHLDVKPYTCKHCGKEFTWLNALEYHERTHTGERPYSCQLCSQKFKTPSDLKRHQVVHTKEKPFACNLCPKKFSQGTTLRKHVAKIHPKPNRIEPVGQNTLDQIISLIPILQQDVQVAISNNTIEFIQADENCITNLSA